MLVKSADASMDVMRREYLRPEVSDYGDLWTITATAHPVFAAAVQDLSFSSPYSPQGEPGGREAAGGGAGPGGAGGAAPAAAGGGAGAGSGGGGAGGHGGGLPFTGLAVGAVAAIGSGLTAAGGALRRALKRRER